MEDTQITKKKPKRIENKTKESNIELNKEKEKHKNLREKTENLIAKHKQEILGIQVKVHEILKKATDKDPTSFRAVSLDELQKLKDLTEIVGNAQSLELNNIDYESKSVAQQILERKIEQSKPRNDARTNTKYNPLRDNIVTFFLASEGASEDDIAEALGVDIQSFRSWKNKYPAIAQALQGKREAVDNLLKATAFQNAIGHFHKEPIYNESGDKIGDKEVWNKPNTVIMRLLLAHRCNIKETTIIENKNNINDFDFSKLQQDERDLLEKLLNKSKINN